MDVYEYGQKMPALLRQSGLPGDSRAEHGFNNRGDVQNVSPLLLEKYLAVASDLLAHPKLAEEATRLSGLLGSSNSSPTATTSAGGMAKNDGGVTAVKAVGKFAANDNIKSTATGSAFTLADFRSALEAAAKAGNDGVFDVSDGPTTVRGDGRHELRIDLPGGQAVMVTPTGTLWLVGFSSAKAASGGKLIANQEKGDKSYELALRVNAGRADEVVSRVGLVVLSRAKVSGEVKVTATFTDGSTAALTQEMPEGAGSGNTFFGFQAPQGEGVSSLTIDGSKFAGDDVLIDDLAFITSASPSDARRPAVVPTPVRPRPVSDREGAKTGLTEFMTRAIRRPVAPTLVELYLTPYDRAKAAGLPDEDAVKESLKAVLASPDFLFLSEPVDSTQGPVRPLGDFELASRLSYFLWASMPDDELLAVAASGKLRDPVVLEQQARRMLKDPKVRELSESFAVQWLRLNELWAAQPDRQLFKSFYAGPQGKNTLHAEMMAEALLLFETVLIEDRDVRDFVNPGYA